MVGAQALGACGLGRVGSSRSSGTVWCGHLRELDACYFRLDVTADGTSERVNSSL